MIKAYFGRHVTYPLLKSDFNENCIFSTDFRKNLKYKIVVPEYGDDVEYVNSLVDTIFIMISTMLTLGLTGLLNW
jgi:hypothetical protein